MAEDLAAQKQGNFPRPRSEVCRKVAEEQAAQRLRCCGGQNAMIFVSIESGDRNRCMKDSQFCKL